MQVVAVLHRDTEQPTHVFGDGTERAAMDKLQSATDGGQRGAQLMADRGDKLCLHLLDPNLLGDIPDESVKADQTVVGSKFGTAFFAYLYDLPVGMNQAIGELEGRLAACALYAFSQSRKVIRVDDTGIAAAPVIDQINSRIASNVFYLVTQVRHAQLVVRATPIHRAGQVADHAAEARLALLQGARGFGQVGNIGGHAKIADGLAVLVGDAGDRQIDLPLLTILAPIGPGAGFRAALPCLVEKYLQTIYRLSVVGTELLAALFYFAG